MVGVHLRGLAKRGGNACTLSPVQDYSEGSCKSAEEIFWAGRVPAGKDQHFIAYVTPGCWRQRLLNVDRVCAGELEEYANLEEQQDTQIFSIVSSTAMFDQRLNTVVNEAVPESDLAARGFLLAVLALIGQAPGGKLHEAELHAGLQDLDQGLRSQVHPVLGDWRESLKGLVKSGYLTVKREVTDTASASSKMVPVFRFGPQARLHLGIGNVGGVLKALESGMEGDEDALMTAAGNKVLRSWYGLEKQMNKKPLKMSDAKVVAGKAVGGQKRSRAAAGGGGGD